MKKVFLLAGAVCLMAFASCHSNTSSEAASQAGESIDSMVEQATSAVQRTGDSVAQGVQDAADTVGAKIDSFKKSH